MDEVVRAEVKEPGGPFSFTQKSVFITTARRVVWRVWVGADGQPLIERWEEGR